MVGTRSDVTTGLWKYLGRLAGIAERRFSPYHSHVTEAIFIGIDLAWRGENRLAGVAVLKGDRNRAQLVDVTGSQVSSGVLEYVKEHASGTAFVAIDAPSSSATPEGNGVVKPQLATAMAVATHHATPRTFLCIRKRPASISRHN